MHEWLSLIKLVYSPRGMIILMGHYRALEYPVRYLHITSIVPVGHHGCLRKNKLHSDGTKHKEDVVLAYEISGHSPSIIDRMILDHHVQLGNQYSTFDNNAKRALNEALQGIMVDSVFDKYREKVHQLYRKSKKWKPQLTFGEGIVWTG